MARISLSVISQKPANGYVIYRGPSRIDGQEIVVIATGFLSKSENDKTGAIIQTWILRADRSPIEAVNDGSDESVCGDCIHRTVNGAGSCYVNVAQGPLAVWNAWTKGRYPVATAAQVAELCAGRQVRIGSYGDPVAVPAEIWNAMRCNADSWTGYTHQWRRAMARDYRSFLMASADTDRQQASARARGWRTFRVKQATDPVLSGEIVCPASAEKDYSRTCESCMACDGAQGNAARVSVVINVHGLAWKAQRYAKAQKALSQKKRFRVRGV